MEVEITGGSASDMRHQKGTKFGVFNLTMAGDLVLTSGHPTIVSLNNGGAARNVDMPAIVGSEGMFFVVHNVTGGAFTVTVRGPGGTPTLEALAQGAGAILYNDGAAWQSFQGT